MIKGMEKAKKDTRLPLKMIAMVSGITYRTLRKWMKDGEEYKQQIEDGKIKKGDLTTKQKREIELFEKLSVESVGKVDGYIETIYKFAMEKKDIKSLQWLLKLEDPIFREVDIDVEEPDTRQISNDVVVVNIAPCGTETSEKLLSDFMNGVANDGEEKEGRSEDAEGGNK